MKNKNFRKTMTNLRVNDVANFVKALENLLNIFNEYAIDGNNDQIRFNNENSLDEMTSEMDNLTLRHACLDGKYDFQDKFITFDVYGYIKTFDHQEFFDIYVADNNFIKYCDEKEIDLLKVIIGE